MSVVGVFQSRPAIVLVEHGGAHPGPSVLGPATRQRVIGEIDAVIGVPEHLEADIGGGGAVEAGCGGVQDGLDLGLRGLEVVGGDGHGGLGYLNGGRVGGHVARLGERRFALLREARGFTGDWDRDGGGGGGGGGRGLAVVAGGGGEREKEEEGEEGEREKGSHGEEEEGRRVEREAGRKCGVLRRGRWFPGKRGHDCGNIYKWRKKRVMGVFGI